MSRDGELKMEEGNKGFVYEAEEIGGTKEV